jgi:hypothetical protein
MRFKEAGPGCGAASQMECSGRRRGTNGSDRCFFGVRSPGFQFDSGIKPIEERRGAMAKTHPPPRHVHLWGVSMTIAAIILGLYLISLFYFSVMDSASGSRDQSQPVTTYR